VSASSPSITSTIKKKDRDEIYDQRGKEKVIHSLSGSDREEKRTILTASCPLLQVVRARGESGGGERAFHLEKEKIRGEEGEIHARRNLLS